MQYHKVLSVAASMFAVTVFSFTPVSAKAEQYIDLNATENTTSLSGSEILEQVGSDLNAEADFNGDGYSDLLVAANGSDRAGNLAGGIYLFYGSENGITSTSVNEADAFFHGGIESISPLDMDVGDLNNDGYSDLMYSGYVGLGKAAAYLFYGSATQFAGEYGNDAADATFFSDGDTEYIGSSLSMNGDVDNDGYADLLLGDDAKNSSKGAAYLFYGSSTAFAGDVNITTADANWQGGEDGMELGTKVELGGDLNGDGFDDVLVGVRNQQVFGSDNGTLRLYYSSATRFTGAYSPNDADAYFTDSASNARMGDQFEVIGDINGDAIDDLAFKKPWANEYTGEVNVVYGQNENMSGQYLPSETQDIKLTGSLPDDGFGTSIGGGDVNGDGVNDLVITSPGFDPTEVTTTNPGAAFVVYGLKSYQNLGVALEAVGAEAAETILYTTATVGDISVAGFVADLNADGVSEVVTSAQYADGTFDAEGKVSITSIPLPDVAGIATDVNNTVVVAFMDGNWTSIQCFETGTGKAKALLSSNTEFVYCVKPRGKELRVFDVRNGQEVDRATLFGKRHKTLRIRKSTFFPVKNSDQFYVLGKSKQNVRLAYASISATTGEITVKNRKLADATALTTSKYNLKINSSKKRANVIKDGEKIKSYLIKKGKLQ